MGEASFRVDLDSYRGPLDLLLYLVRKHEVDITEIPIAVITEQFLGYLDLLEQLDVNYVGDFIEMASTLIELKSRTVLPSTEEQADQIDDPRDELVQRLLEYKKFKDAASMLEEKSRNWQQRYPRLSNDLPPRKADLADQPIQELELWDLVSAFGRIVRDSQATRPSNIVYDDTPIHTHMERIHERLLRDGRVAFSEMFASGMHKSSLIGVFLAILELVRHHSVTTRQDEAHGEIWVLPGTKFSEQVDLSDVDNYGSETPEIPDAPENSETSDS